MIAAFRSPPTDDAIARVMLADSQQLRALIRGIPKLVPYVSWLPLMLWYEFSRRL